MDVHIHPQYCNAVPFASSYTDTAISSNSMRQRAQRLPLRLTTMHPHDTVAGDQREACVLVFPFQVKKNPVRGKNFSSSLLFIPVWGEVRWDERGGGPAAIIVNNWPCRAFFLTRPCRPMVGPPHAGPMDVVWLPLSGRRCGPYNRPVSLRLGGWIQ